MIAQNDETMQREARRPEAKTLRFQPPDHRDWISHSEEFMQPTAAQKEGCFLSDPLDKTTKNPIAPRRSSKDRPSSKTQHRSRSSTREAEARAASSTCSGARSASYESYDSSLEDIRIGRAASREDDIPNTDVKPAVRSRTRSSSRSRKHGSMIKASASPSPGPQQKDASVLARGERKSLTGTLNSEDAHIGMDQNGHEASDNNHGRSSKRSHRKRDKENGDCISISDNHLTCSRSLPSKEPSIRNRTCGASSDERESSTKRKSFEASSKKNGHSSSKRYGKKDNSNEKDNDWISRSEDLITSSRPVKAKKPSRKQRGGISSSEDFEPNIRRHTCQASCEQDGHPAREKYGKRCIEREKDQSWMSRSEDLITSSRPLKSEKHARKERGGISSSEDFESSINRNMFEASCEQHGQAADGKHRKRGIKYDTDQNWMSRSEELLADQRTLKPKKRYSTHCRGTSSSEDFDSSIHQTAFEASRRQAGRSLGEKKGKQRNKHNNDNNWMTRSEDILSSSRPLKSKKPSSKITSSEEFETNSRRRKKGGQRRQAGLSQRTIEHQARQDWMSCSEDLLIGSRPIPRESTWSPRSEENLDSSDRLAMERIFNSEDILTMRHRNQQSSNRSSAAVKNSSAMTTGQRVTAKKSASDWQIPSLGGGDAPRLCLPRCQSGIRSTDPWEGSLPLDTGAPRMYLPGSAGGLIPTTRHIFKLAVNAPPLHSAWLACRQKPGWYISRSCASWVFKANEGVLFHVDTETLWAMEHAMNDQDHVVHRIDLMQRKALLSLAELGKCVLMRVCFVQWRRTHTPKGQANRTRPKKLQKCIVCLDYFLVSDTPGPAFVGPLKMPSVGGICFSTCGHVLCTECLASYAVSAIDLHQWRDAGLRCAMPGCRKVLSGEVVLKAASFSEAQRDALASHLCRLMLVRPVHCPNPACSAVYESADRSLTNPQSTCVECGTVFCRACRCEWHWGATCAEHAMQLSAEDVSLMRLAEELGWKRCNKCGTMVERLDGCNHVQCATCGHDFCYRCGGPFDSNTYRCLDRRCTIYQGREDRPHQRVAHAFALLRGGSWFQPLPEQPPLTGVRIAFLREWAAEQKPGVDLSLLQRGPLSWATLPAWQQQMLQDNQCPYCRLYVSRGADDTNNINALQRHLRTSSCSAHVWTCCGRLFASVEEMDVHVRSRHA